MTERTLDDMFALEKNPNKLIHPNNMEDVFYRAQKEGRLLVLPALSVNNKTYIAIGPEKQGAFLVTQKAYKNNECVGNYYSMSGILNILQQYIACNTGDLVAAATQEYTPDSLSDFGDDVPYDERERLLEQKRSASRIISDASIIDCLRQRQRLEKTMDILREHAGVEDFDDPVFHTLQSDSNKEIAAMMEKVDPICGLLANQVDMFDLNISTINQAEIDSTQTYLPEDAVMAKDKSQSIAKKIALENTTLFFRRN